MDTATTTLAPGSIAAPDSDTVHVTDEEKAAIVAAERDRVLTAVIRERDGDSTAYRCAQRVYPDLTGQEWTARRTGTWQSSIAHPVVAETVTDGPERECLCEHCAYEHCQGDCDSCDDHSCEACYGHHTANECCGYCVDCDSHPEAFVDRYEGGRYWRVCDQRHCHECEHNCDNY